jgi:DNA-binding NtrC family response regulator
LDKKILLIDDDVMFRELIRISIQDEFPQVEVVEARTAYSGERMLQSDKFDLILLDYKLPFGMNGLRFLEKTRDLRSGIPLIMISAEGNEHIAARAFTLGATDYLVKTELLLMKLKSVVKKIIGENKEQINDEDSDNQVGVSLNTANSGIELVKKYQEELNNNDTEASLSGETMMMEFDQIREFNKFTKLIRFLHGVTIKDMKILENKYIVLLAMLPTRYQRSSALS